MNKVLKIVAIIAGVLFLGSLVFGAIIIINPSGTNGEYGNRLAGIENVQIDNSVISKIENSLNEIEQVSSVSYNLQGKLMKFTVNLSKNVDTSKLGTYTKIITDNLVDEQLKFYDIQVLFLCEEGNYPVYASKHKSSDKFYFTVMGLGE